MSSKVIGTKITIPRNRLRAINSSKIRVASKCPHLVTNFSNPIANISPAVNKVIFLSRFKIQRRIMFIANIQN